jgi:hypothetical protein
MSSIIVREEHKLQMYVSNVLTIVFNKPVGKVHLEDHEVGGRVTCT